MATIKVVIVDPYGVVRHTDIEDSLESFQSVVEGYIQPVYGPDVVIYMNEDGIQHDLPFNPHASMFATQVLGRRGMRLFGTALFVGPDDGEGGDTDVRPAVVDYFTKEN
jgi:hypothetical protein